MRDSATSERTSNGSTTKERSRSTPRQTASATSSGLSRRTRRSMAGNRSSEPGLWAEVLAVDVPRHHCRHADPGLPQVRGERFGEPAHRLAGGAVAHCPRPDGVARW